MYLMPTVLGRTCFSGFHIVMIYLDLQAGASAIVIRSDASVPIPVSQAFKGRGSFTILQIDAHIDWRHEVNGERFDLSSTMHRASEMPWLKVSFR